MTFSERPPSQQWELMTYRGAPLAEVWFKPDGAALALTFRIPLSSFDIPAVGPYLTAENLLKTVGIPLEDVETCFLCSQPAPENEARIELTTPLAPPQAEETHRQLFIKLKQPIQNAADAETIEAKHLEVSWQELQARWNKILGIEAYMDTMRISLESVRIELEASVSKTLSGDDKLFAPNGDVAQWNKAKSRVRFALPKVKEFIHRATWAVGTPERKKLQELFKDQARPHLPPAQMRHVADELEGLLKQRQVLNAHGISVFQECKAITAEVQGALKTLQRNAAVKAIKSRASAFGKSKPR